MIDLTAWAPVIGAIIAALGLGALWARSRSPRPGRDGVERYRMAEQAKAEAVKERALAELRGQILQAQADALRGKADGVRRADDRPGEAAKVLDELLGHEPGEDG